MTTDLLNGCLVDGDSEQLKRERQIRRRALAISISLQAITLAVILLVPLLGKPAQISWNVVPVPPYYSRPVRPQVVETTVARHPRFKPDTLIVPTFIPTTIDPNPQPPDPGETGVPVQNGIDMSGVIPLTE